MRNQSKSKKFVGAISKAGKSTAKGAGFVGLGLAKALANANDINRRNDIRQKLECIDNYDLEIAKSIIEERISRM